MAKFLFLWGSVVAALAVGGPGLAEESVLLQRKAWNGQKLRVEESERTEIDAKARAAGPAGWSSTRTEDWMQSETRTYRQEMAAVGKGWEVRRSYQKAVRASEGLPSLSSRDEPRTSSLQGKTVVVSLRGATGGSLEALEGRIALEDQEDARFPEKLYALLPRESVKPGQAWDVPGGALAEVFLGKTPRAGGATRAEFRRIARVDGTRCAELAYRLEGEGEPAAAMLHFALDEGTILAFEMSGPVTGSARGIWTSVDATGKRTIRYRAHIEAKGEPGGVLETVGEGRERPRDRRGRR